MARIRSQHPGIFTDEAYMALSFAAREALRGLWAYADDHGVFEWKPVTLKARIFPADSVSFPALLTELEKAGFVRAYQAEGRSFGVVRNFVKYQRPRKPSYVHPLPVELYGYVGMPGSGRAEPWSGETEELPPPLTAPSTELTPPLTAPSTELHPPLTAQKAELAPQREEEEKEEEKEGGKQEQKRSRKEEAKEGGKQDAGTRGAGTQVAGTQVAGGGKPLAAAAPPHRQQSVMDRRSRGGAGLRIPAGATGPVARLRPGPRCAVQPR